MLRLLTFLALVVSVLGAQLEEVEVNTRIVNRAKADIKDYPYMVSVRWGIAHMYGGTIIHTSFVLTCARAGLGSNLSVEYGSTELGKGTVVPVQAVIRHGGYTAYEFLHDIAVLKFVAPLLFKLDELSIISKEECEDFYKEENLDYSICARYPGDMIIPYNYVAGGAVILNGTQVGIISSSSNNDSYPALFTKVAHYMEWISNLINNDGTCRFKLVSI